MRKIWDNVSKRVGHCWFEFRWCFHDLWNMDLDNLMEKIGMFVFICLGSVAAMVLSPFLIFFGIFYLIYFAGIAAKHFINWIRDKVAITLVCTLAGLLLGIYGGATGAAIGAASGFFMGFIFELIRWTDNGTTWNNDDKGSWFGLTDHDPPTGNNVVYNSYEGGIVRVKTYEKPWSWRGFQTENGPREDDLRKDL